MPEPLLEVKNLTCRYRAAAGDIPAVENANLTIFRGEILGIAGESGCGKSTLAAAILRLLVQPGYVANGEVIFHPRNGEPIDLLKVGPRELRALRWSQLSYLPQGSMNSLNPVMKVGDQFVDVMQAHRSWSKSEASSKVPDLLQQVGLDPMVADMYAHELSGGMKQRVITAMAVALGPDLLLADEPTTALDVTIQRVVIQNLYELRDKFGVTLVIITHDMGVHAQLVDRVAIMYAGKIVEVGDVRQIFKEPKDAYTRSLIDSIPTLDVDQRQRRKVREEIS
ncbi:MAG TPA: ABC transporter ATP-binding protein [Candidatus Dormibacteraeota bacterium]|jgi:peptide/nickel transport system ATP-binding protein|nr:ABC transporter ATP-binding protein [Candidatus Dormibacteraeota bacterium]